LHALKIIHCNRIDRYLLLNAYDADMSANHSSYHIITLHAGDGINAVGPYIGYCMVGIVCNGSDEITAEVKVLSGGNEVRPVCIVYRLCT